MPGNGEWRAWRCHRVEWRAVSWLRSMRPDNFRHMSVVGTRSIVGTYTKSSCSSVVMITCRGSWIYRGVKSLVGVTESAILRGVLLQIPQCGIDTSSPFPEAYLIRLQIRISPLFLCWAASHKSLIGRSAS